MDGGFVFKSNRSDVLDGDFEVFFANLEADFDGLQSTFFDGAIIVDEIGVIIDRDVDVIFHAQGCATNHKDRVAVFIMEIRTGDDVGFFQEGAIFAFGDSRKQRGAGGLRQGSGQTAEAIIKGVK